MNGPDHYLTLAEESGAQLREKASRFIAYAFPIADEDDFKQRLEALAAKHHDSRHVCYAWVLGRAVNGTGPTMPGTERHGQEPHPAAPPGRRAHVRGRGGGALLRGTKLGRGGLVRAYGDVARGGHRCEPYGDRDRAGGTALPVCLRSVERIRQQVLDLGGQGGGTTVQADCDMHVTLPRMPLPGSGSSGPSCVTKRMESRAPGP